MTPNKENKKMKNDLLEFTMNDKQILITAKTREEFLYLTKKITESIIIYRKAKKIKNKTERINSLHKQGLSIREIANMENMSSTAVHYHLHKEEQIDFNRKEE